MFNLDGKFTEVDKQQFVDFLNFIATRANFNKLESWTTEDTIKHFKLLAHMQQVILRKIEANILEVIEIRKTQENKEAAKVEAKAAKK